jgi:hypothetical protein
MAPRYTHVKILTEKIDNAVGYALALISYADLTSDQVFEATKAKFNLEVIDLILVKEKYRGVLIRYGNNPDPVKPTVQLAIADYTVAEIESHKVATLTTVIQNDADDASLTAIDEDAQIKAHKAKILAAIKENDDRRDQRKAEAIARAADKKAKTSA